MLPKPITLVEEKIMTQQLASMIDGQNSAIMLMINRMTEDKEKKMKDKNMKLMNRIKALERKRRRLNGDNVSETGEEDLYEDMESISRGASPGKEMMFY